MPEFTAPALPAPKTGELEKGFEYLFVKERAPLRIVTAERNGNYLIKLTSAATGKEVAQFFLRAGDTLEVDVPVGTYNLRYAYGDTWYGPKYLFGPTTHCARADRSFRFSIMDDHAEGHEIELIKQIGGNLETEEIPVAEF